MDNLNIAIISGLVLIILLLLDRIWNRDNKKESTTKIQ